MYGMIQFAPLPTRYRGVSILIIQSVRPPLPSILIYNEPQAHRLLLAIPLLRYGAATATR